MSITVYYIKTVKTPFYQANRCSRQLNLLGNFLNRLQLFINDFLTLVH